MYELNRNGLVQIIWLIWTSQCLSKTQEARNEEIILCQTAGVSPDKSEEVYLKKSIFRNQKLSVTPGKSTLKFINY